MLPIDATYACFACQVDGKSMTDVFVVESNTRHMDLSAMGRSGLHIKASIGTHLS